MLPSAPSPALRAIVEAPKLAAPDEDPLLHAMGYEPLTLDELQARTGLSSADLHAQLLALELAGQVARLPGARVQRMAAA